MYLNIGVTLRVPTTQQVLVRCLLNQQGDELGRIIETAAFKVVSMNLFITFQIKIFGSTLVCYNMNPTFHFNNNKANYLNKLQIC